MSRTPLWFQSPSKRALFKVFTHEQLIKAFEKVSDPYLLVAVFMAFISGLRISELCDLKKDNVDLKDKKIYVFKGKGGKDAVIDIVDDKFIPILQKYMDFHRRHYPLSEYLFPTYDLVVCFRARAFIIQIYNIFVFYAASVFPEIHSSPVIVLLEFPVYNANFVQYFFCLSAENNNNEFLVKLALFYIY